MNAHASFANEIITVSTVACNRVLSVTTFSTLYILLSALSLYREHPEFQRGDGCERQVADMKRQFVLMNGFPKEECIAGTWRTLQRADLAHVELRIFRDSLCRRYEST